ncbi:hypothetical protein [Lentzea flava]|uniref:Uncharacterized protein n=1 Tax=Lentzea flava TaxID=103732 RepID=A0ABQ2UFW2_9PSEU|nr:hypothetical protein [Lentzea flava]MCP2198246.1 hypothetical protein [Lentzea flava]GGU31187.1 hypothetical protein GCM10010178_24380 [Lentzea flava]
MNLPVLAGVEPGADFHAMVDAIAERVRPEKSWVAVLLDDQPDSSARLDLVRLAVIAALERGARAFQVVPVTACYWHPVGGEWLVSREEPARPFTFSNGSAQPPERTVTLAETGSGTVLVRVNGTQVEVRPPSEHQCRTLLESGVRGTPLRFPVFPSSGPSMIARGTGPHELVLWRCGLPATRFRLPGPVLAAIHVTDPYLESLTALIEVDGELVVHCEGNQDTGLHELRVPIGFSVAEEAERDLSPLYLDLDEPWRFGVYFRRAGQWWNLHYRGGDITLEPSRAVLHQPGSVPFHTKIDGAGRVLFGPDHSTAGLRDTGWTAWGPGLEDTVIPVPSGEQVLALTKIAGRPALLTREGDALRVRLETEARTVVEHAGPVVHHYGLPWVAVQRSAHLVEVLDVATGAVLHRLGTA